MTISKWIFLALSVLFAFVAERWFSFFLPDFFSVPPIAAFAIASWLFVLPSGGRILLAAIAGFILDSMSAFPFGTYTVLFFLYCGVAAFVRAHLVESKRRLASLAWGAIVFLTAPFGIAGAGIVISFFRSVAFRVTLAELSASAAAAFLWAVVFLFVAGVVPALARRFHLFRKRLS